MFCVQGSGIHKIKAVFPTEHIKDSLSRTINLHQTNLETCQYPYEMYMEVQTRHCIHGSPWFQALLVNKGPAGDHGEGGQCEQGNINYSSYYKAVLGWLRVTSFLKVVHSLYKSLPASLWVKTDNSFFFFFL